ncbi:aldo/keto reductase [Streptosporangium sp. NBC_01755]|uniref:aldo/keto reductase n=1 Tax=Streptosporangium sp. NBC_01755 TaxID=2975949 RepID=UPI002DD8A5FB|nr:aldo/keto reductase [Streptosporangium sp. NBC_01755]WSD01343.1 aldo/keto reductase [Streptosporangium sp. NBC_01755]
MTGIRPPTPRLIGSRQVGPVGLGGARWSLAAEPDEAAALATLHAAVDAGVTLVDTAPAYVPASCPGRSHNEELIARGLAAHPRGSSVLVATKGGHWRDPSGGFPVDARPETLRRHCLGSLAALGVPRIDLYQLHWPDPEVPIADSVGALARLREEGLVELVGVCNVGLVQLREATARTRVDAVQNRFSVLDRADRAVLDHCTAHGIAYLAYSPFGGPAGARGLAGRLPALGEIALARGVSAHEVAIAWLLAQSPVIVPIVGAGRPASVATAVRGAGLVLSEEELRSLDRAEPPTQNAGW